MSKIISYINHLQDELHLIEIQMQELLDASTIKEHVDNPRSTLIGFTPPYYWGNTDEKQKRLQIKLLKIYSTWFEHFCLLFRDATKEIEHEIKNTNEFIESWIEKKGSWDVPSTIQEAKSMFQEKIEKYYELMALLDTSKENKLMLIPDTNALIIAPDVVQYSEVVGEVKYTIIIFPTVTQELDNLKISHRDIQFRNKVDSVIRRLKGLRQQGNLLKGVTVNKTITVRMNAKEPNFNNTLNWLDPKNNDDRIIASSLELQWAYPSNKIVLVTADVNLQNKAEFAKLPYVEPPRCTGQREAPFGVVDES